MDRQLIEDYASGGEKLHQSVMNLTRADMQMFPVPGTWSIQQIIIHMQDSDLIGADRMKRIIAEENPTLIGYDETNFSKNLHYDEQSIDDALILFDLNRRQMTKILRKLPDEAFARTGMHSERGKVTLEQQLTTYVNHLEHHLKFILDKREKLGKLMW